MDYYSHEEIASVIFYNLRLAEGELLMYEACVNYTIENCPESQVYEMTGCESKDELIGVQEDLVYLLKKITEKRWLPDRFEGYDPPNYIKGLE